VKLNKLLEKIKQYRKKINCHLDIQKNIEVASKKRVDKAHKLFNQLERDQGTSIERRKDFYDLSRDLIRTKYKLQGYLLFLATWNFARFRYALRDLDLNSLTKLMKGIEKKLKKYKKNNFWEMEFTKKFKETTVEVFEKLDKIKGIEHTGSPKLMHLICPEVYVMWDQYIRNHYQFKIEKKTKNKGLKYYNFLIKMKKMFSETKSNTKLIDEYNYVFITRPHILRNNLNDLHNKLSKDLKAGKNDFPNIKKKLKRINKEIQLITKKS